MGSADLRVVHDEHAQAPAPRDRGYLGSQDVLARMTRILEIMESVMKDGVHYGQIPGTPKPTLYKAGAEKLLTTFQIAAVMKDVVDLSTADEARYRVRVEGISQASGVVLGEAWGECSSNEEKYRWRSPVCDEEFNEAPADQRREKFKRGQGGKAYKQKQVRTSPADVANTILQMATKRALVPMTRVVLACSDIFAQDLEDMPEELRESVVEGESKPGIQAPQRKSETKPADPPAAAAPLPPGAVLVTRVVPVPFKQDGQTRTAYVVFFSTNEKAATLSETLAESARLLLEKQTPVIPDCKPGAKPNTFELIGFKTPPADPPVKPTETPGLTAEDIPWSS